MKSKMAKFYTCFVVLSIMAGMVLGFFILQAPRANTSDTTRFMASNCAADLEEIAKEPHSIRDDEARAAVREYLLLRLEEMGLETKVFNYNGGYDEFFEQDVDVNNILATTEGEYESYVLLMAHYDSSVGKRLGEMDGSHGAADDGYGLSVILELMRLMQNEPKVNGIKVLFTDAEETTGTAPTYGSAFAIQEPEVLEKVSFVINLEAHGIRGPAVMFETSANNAKLINLYKKADMPTAISIANAIYQKMPNDTDLTTFIHAGYAGINFGVMDSVAEYHTPEDNLVNIDLNALQSYGDQLEPILRAYVSNAAYSDPDWTQASYSMIYSNIAPNVLVVYPSWMTWIFLGLSVVLLVYALWREKFKFMRAQLAWAGAMLGGMAVFALLGYITSHLVATPRIPFSLTYMPSIPHADAIFAVLCILEIIVFSLLAVWGVKRFANPQKMLIGGAFIQLLFTIVLIIVLPEGSFLYLFTTILAVAVSILYTKTEWSRFIACVGVVFGISQCIMVVWLFYLSLLIGGLFVYTIVLGLYLCSIVPGAIAIWYKNPQNVIPKP